MEIKVEKYYELDKESQDAKRFAQKCLVEKLKEVEFESLLEIGPGSGDLLNQR
jgi:16S rRNA A1518/A1519 N6-dimethyltransferase RsmA/KsgA/DIM1 with predicted DNA glycosylase/AP lyase activity